MEEAHRLTLTDLADSKGSVDNSGEDGIIDVEIDKFVPCLEDAKTGEILQTEVTQLKRSELKKYRENNGWSLNWSKVPKECEVFGIYIKGESEPQGLIALTKEKGGVFINNASTAPHNNKLITGGSQKYYGVGGIYLR